MQIKGNGVAIALGLVAVAIAATGTAYAVTATQVNIADPSAPTHVARVDATGHLSTADPASTLVYTETLSTPAAGSLNILTTPTTATLAITKIEVGNPNPASSDLNAHYAVYLEKVGVDGNNNCSAAVSGVALQTWEVAPESHIVAPFPAPLVIKPTAGAPYCLALYGQTVGGGSDSGSYYAYANFTGYVVSGKYTGKGTQAVGAQRVTPQSLLRRKR